MIMVDNDNLDGKFGYTNVEGDVEYVEVSENYPDAVVIYNWNHNGLNEVYVKDIPKLIKALQAAYDYTNNKENT